jgi:hypothetical protein
MSAYDAPSLKRGDAGPILETPPDLVFDDEPIDSILYSDSPEPATAASIFAPARVLVERMRGGQDQPDFHGVLLDCEEFIDYAEPITPAQYTALCEALLVAHVRAFGYTDVRRETLERIVKLCLARELRHELPPILTRLVEGMLRAAVGLR